MLLHSFFPDGNPCREGRIGDIYFSLFYSPFIDVNGNDICFWITLCHHQGYQSCTCPNIQDSFTTLSP